MCDSRSESVPRLDSTEVVAISPAITSEAALQPDPAAYTLIRTCDHVDIALYF